MVNFADRLLKLNSIEISYVPRSKIIIKNECLIYLFYVKKFKSVSNFMDMNAR